MEEKCQKSVNLNKQINLTQKSINFQHRYCDKEKYDNYLSQKNDKLDKKVNKTQSQI